MPSGSNQQWYIQPNQAGYSGGKSSGVPYGSSSSSSSTTPTQTVENNIMNAVSGVASSMASYLSNWATQQYAKTSGVTDQAVNNFFQTASSLGDLAKSQTGEYNNLVADANSYASTSHMAADMGMAGATQAQAGEASEQNSMAQLQQYGIDPSSGRYAGLVHADQVQNAANVAGAENAQRVSDIATAQSLRASESTAANSIANTQNSATTANTAAANASLANANTGVNLMGAADPYLNTAMSVKMPFSSSTSSSQSQGYAPTASSPGGGSGGGSSGGGSGGITGVSGGSGNTSSGTSSYQTGAVGGAGSPYGGSPSDTSYGGGSSGGGYTDTGTMTTDPMAGDVSPSSGYGNSFARGGAVPPSASPSYGQKVDDVRAQGPGNAPMHLNANEFVIPQDVALWKGQEFFQNLINDSRKKRMSPGGAPAKPSVGAPQAMGVQ